MFEEGKTSYSIVDEHGDKSSITIEKWEADLLQESLQDVHRWIQQTYSRVSEKSVHLSRIMKGNVVRKHAHYEATKHPKYSEWIVDL